MASNKAALIKHLENELAKATRLCTDIDWQLRLARAQDDGDNVATAEGIVQSAALARGELIRHPADELARQIVQAGRRRRGEIQ